MIPRLLQNDAFLWVPVWTYEETRQASLCSSDMKLSLMSFNPRGFKHSITNTDCTWTPHILMKIEFGRFIINYWLKIACSLMKIQRSDGLLQLFKSMESCFFSFTVCPSLFFHAISPSLVLLVASSVTLRTHLFKKLQRPTPLPAAFFKFTSSRALSSENLEF